MKLLLILLGLLLTGCIHLQTVGDEPYCLVDLQTGLKMCDYPTYRACTEALRDHTICMERGKK